MDRELLVNLRKLLEVYPRADREKWNLKRKNAIIEITKELNRLDNDLELFEHFWEMYPIKKNKPDSKKAWQQTINSRPDLSTILNAVKKQILCESWMRDGGQFIPHPATWLRGHRWGDEIEVKLSGVVNEKPWHETASGIEAKGKELGLDPSQFDHWQAFKVAVMQKSLKAA